MGKITTHVLDTMAGKPAAGVRVRLFRGAELLNETVTNSDGRCDSPLIENPSAGCYEIVFSIGEFYHIHGTESPFLGEVPIRFSVEVGQHYHVPLLCTPWSYSTYRGS
ncbi:hydroxyisourate hydrolase [Luteolibacter sp. AS25]|uniref:hydroxyisourate hydrolase n=1 Tax=Luteolibacter sp. AS25 TaxID=3135776 RepID=UPI00398B6B6C